jgi:predicted aspartyl protease
MSPNWLSFKRNSIPIISVRIAGRRYEAMVDTGAAVSLVSPELTIRLGLARQGVQPIISVHGDVRHRTIVMLPYIGVAGFDLAPCKATIVNMAPLKPGVDLLLGVNAFINCRLDIDFKEGRIYIYPER